MIEPRLRRLEAVALLEQLPRRMVEEVHPLIGEERNRDEESDCNDDVLSHGGGNPTATAAARWNRPPSSRSGWCLSSSSWTSCRSSSAALSSASALWGSARAAARSAAARSTARRWRSWPCSP